MAAETPLASALGRERLIVAGGLAAVVVLAAAWLLAGAGMDMAALRPMAWTPGYAAVVLAMWWAMMAAMMLPSAAPMAWTPASAAVVLAMWWAMMAAMMLPSAAPMILLFAAVNRRARADGTRHVPTAAFVLGYLLVWGAFSAIATGAQWGLARAALLSPAMAASSALLGGILLVGAGAWQLTPLKHACLRHCRAPFAFVSRHWRPGARGAVRMGAVHGAVCLGCCWVLMALLFYGGVMNPVWIIGLALYVLVEKCAPFGHAVGAMSGLALIAWGGMVIAAA